MPRFISMLYVDGAALDALGPEGNKKLNTEMSAYDRGLIAQGKLLMGAAMASPRDAVTVRRRKDGVSVTDGPYADTKEHIGGFVIYEVADRDEVLAILAGDPMAPYAEYEVREIKSPDDPDWDEWAAKTYGPR